MSTEQKKRNSTLAEKCYNARTDVISTFDTFSGQDSSNFMKVNSQTVQPTYRNQALSPIDKKDSKTKIKNVSERFKQNCDIHNINSFKYVGQTSTMKEKTLKTRAALLANQQGLMING